MTREERHYVEFQKTEQRAVGAFGGVGLSFALMAAITSNLWLLIPAAIATIGYIVFFNK